MIQAMLIVEAEASECRENSLEFRRHGQYVLVFWHKTLYILNILQPNCFLSVRTKGYSS